MLVPGDPLRGETIVLSYRETTFIDHHREKPLALAFDHLVERGFGFPQRKLARHLFVLPLALGACFIAN